MDGGLIQETQVIRFESELLDYLPLSSLSSPSIPFGPIDYTS